MNRFTDPLEKTDPTIFDLIEKEKNRQNTGIELIPSESFPSKAVLDALGSVMNNKYSEGYPGKRYYGGNEFADKIETLAIQRCKEVFGCEHVNVQPYSGSPANIEVYFALVPLGEKIMGMELTMGGHLTHGFKVNFSSKAWKACQYGVDSETELLNFDEIREMAQKEQPKLIVSGATAYPRKINFKKFHEIAKEIGAYSMADISHIAGLIAGKVHNSPFPFTDVVTTTSHKTLNGPRGAIIMCKEEYQKKIDRAVFPGMQGGPHDQQVAATAVALGLAKKSDFENYSNQIVKNAKAMAEVFLDGGIRLITGGTDNHLVLADVISVNTTGIQAQNALDKALITTNKNTIPFEKRSPFDPSGLRFGTPAITSRGFNENTCSEVAELMVKVIKNHSDESVIKNVREKVLEITKEFPMYD